MALIYKRKIPGNLFIAYDVDNSTYAVISAEANPTGSCVVTYLMGSAAENNILGTVTQINTLPSYFEDITQQVFETRWSEAVSYLQTK